MSATALLARLHFWNQQAQGGVHAVRGQLAGDGGPLHPAPGLEALEDQLWQRGTLRVVAGDLQALQPLELEVREVVNERRIQVSPPLE